MRTMPSLLEEIPEVLTRTCVGRPPYRTNPNITPFPHQLEQWPQIRDLEKAAMFWRVGTGKTYFDLNDSVRAYCRGEIDAVVVLAPNGVHSDTWVADQIPRHVMVPYTALAYTSKSKATVGQWRALESLAEAPGLRILTTYYEAIASASGWNFVKDFLARAGRVKMTLDESHRIMAPGGRAAIRLANFAAQTVRRRILTATPTGNGLENLYSQFRFLGRDILDVSTFAEYKGMFCVETAIPGTDFKKITGYRNVKYLNKRLAPWVFVAKKPEGLPPQHWVNHFVGMSDEQWTAYGELKELYQTELRNGHWVEAELSIVRMRRLQQIVAGHLSYEDENGKVARHQLDCPRLADTLDVIRGAPDKVIVWAEEHFEIVRLGQVLKEAGIGHELFYGMVRGQARTDAKTRFNQDPDCKVLVANSATGGTGYQLTGDVAPVGDAIFYSHNWSRIIREQCEGRNHRPGAWAERVIYHDMLTRGTVDMTIRARVKKKGDVAELVSDPRGFAALLDEDLDYEPGLWSLTP
jgi:hypothetical protein